MGWIVVAAPLLGAAVSFQAGKPIEAEKSYDTGVAKVELIGVCRATETEVECWDPNGEAAPGLLDEFKNVFLRNEYASVPVRYGLKSRVAVFRFTNPQYNDPRGTIETYFQNSGPYGSFNWPNQGATIEDDKRVEVRAALIVSKLNESFGKVTTSISKSAPPSKRMALEIGSTLDYVGAIFTVHKIVKVPTDAPPTFGASGQRWTIVMTATEQEGLPRQLSLTPIGHDGLVVRAVDKEGNPVVIDPSTIQPQYGPYGGVVPGKYAPAVFQASGGRWTFQRGDDFLITTNVNPTKIKEIYAVGSWSERLTITGIPLEPRK